MTENEKNIIEKIAASGFIAGPGAKRPAHLKPGSLFGKPRVPPRSYSGTPENPKTLVQKGKEDHIAVHLGSRMPRDGETVRHNGKDYEWTDKSKIMQAKARADKMDREEKKGSYMSELTDTQMDIIEKIAAGGQSLRTGNTFGNRNTGWRHNKGVGGKGVPGNSGPLHLGRRESEDYVPVHETRSFKGKKLDVRGGRNPVPGETVRHKGEEYEWTDKSKIMQAKARADKMDKDERRASDMSNLIQDLIEGAQKNSNLAGIELDGALGQAGFTPLDIAKTAGVLAALNEAQFTVKEACEATGLDETTLQAIVIVAQ